VSCVLAAAGAVSAQTDAGDPADIHVSARHAFRVVTIGVQISIGIAVAPEHGTDIKSLVAAAERALY
jgi:GGDEF domain-containing protein